MLSCISARPPDDLLLSLRIFGNIILFLDIHHVAGSLVLDDILLSGW